MARIKRVPKLSGETLEALKSAFAKLETGDPPMTARPLTPSEILDRYNADLEPLLVCLAEETIEFRRRDRYETSWQLFSVPWLSPAFRPHLNLKAQLA